MKVYRAAVEIIDVVIDNRTQLKQTLQGEDLVQCSFTLDHFFDFQLGDYINWRTKTYTIFKQPSVKKVQSNKFQYSIDFESDQYRLLNSLYLLDGQSEFYLVGDLQQFTDLLIENLNRLAGAGYYLLGPVPATDAKNLNFSNHNCLNVLQTISKEFEVEYYLSDDGRTIHFVDTIGSVTALSFEFKDGLRHIERQKVTDKNIVTRLYAFGGTRNIISDYGSKRLQLPGPDGYIEENTGLFGIIEGVVNFDDIYPHREGTVTALGAGILEFFDDAIDFNVNDQLIDGVTAKISFNSGDLAGYEFEIASFNNVTKEFSIVPYEDTNGLILPNDTLKPGIGDAYILHDIEMPQTYIDNAEAELLAKATEYLQENSLPSVMYNIVPDYVHLRTHLIQLNIGDVITIEDEDFKMSIQTRIISLTQSLANPYLYSIKVGDKVAVGYITRVLSNQLELENAITTERYDRKVQYNRIRRNLRDIDELRDSVFDPDGYFDTGNIRPLSIETNMLSVGTKSQQFIIRELLIQPNYQSDPDKTLIGDGVLVHFVIEDNIKEWTLTGAVKNHADPLQYYYIYARCDRLGNTGDFVCSSVQYKVDAGNTYYYFLIGVLHSVQDGVRGISLTYGQTTINGKFITTGWIQSTDGLNFINLDENKLHFGDAGSYLDWNNEDSGKLKLNDATIDNSLMAANLWAEQATIADWKVQNGKITSQNEYNGDPRAQLDGTDGKLTLISPMNTYADDGGAKVYTQTITLDSQAGQLRAEHTGDADQNSGTAYVDSEGVFANFAGIQAVPLASGIEIKGAVVGLGFGKLNKTAYGSSGAICGVFGNASNSTANPAPAYGGYFFNLMAAGLILNTHIVPTGATSYDVSDAVVFVSCYNTAAATIYLPTDPYKGRVVLIKRINASISVDGNGNNFMKHVQVASVNIGDGHLWMFVFDGSYWTANYMGHG